MNERADSFRKGEKKMEREQTHILAISFPEQGHINPMFQFSKRLASKGLKVTLVVNHYAKSTMPDGSDDTNTVTIESISDGSEGASAEAEVEDFAAYFERFKIAYPQGITKLVEKHKCLGNPVKFFIYDSGLPWMLEVGRRLLGIDGVPLFTQSWAVNAIYYHFHLGTLKFPLEVDDSAMISLPSFPLLRIHDLPSFCSDTGPTMLNYLVDQFSNIQEPKWILSNTFDKLEHEVVSWLASRCPSIKNIGPAIPSFYLDKRLENDKEYGLSLFKPDYIGCLTWLDSKETDTVVYVSFGSLAVLGEEQMEELARGLKRSNNYFLWVVRESEKEKLPINFIKETSGKGLVVSWSPQLEVLAHKSVGCFITHCGWNSTLESLSLGVPMVAMPQWTDQATNAKFIADVWKVGVRAKVGEKGIVSKEEIEVCIREIMEGERGKEIRTNSKKWKELAKEAIDDGGSADHNINEFVAQLKLL